MAEEGVEFIVGIKDEMSHPAKSGAEALKRLKTEIGDTEKEVRKLQEEQIKLKEHGLGGIAAQAGLEVQKLKIKLQDLKKEQKELNEQGEHGFFSKLRESLVPEIALGEMAAEGIKMLGEAVYELGEHLVDAGVEMVKFSVESAEFKESATDAYEVLLRSSEKGKETFAEIESMSRSMHIPVEKAQGMAEHLMELGLDNESEVKATIAAVSRLERAGLDGGAGRLQNVIERSLASGHLELGKGGRALKGMGVEMPDLYADLAKRLKVSVPQVDALMKQGKIDTQVGIASLTDLINHSEVAEIADKKFTLKDIAVDWKNAWTSMTEDVSAGPLVGALRDFVSIFDKGSESGKTMKQTITGAVDEIIKWVAQGIEAVGIFVMKFEIGFLNAETAVAPLIKDIREFTSNEDAMKSVGDAAEKIGSGLTKAAIGAAWLLVKFEELREAMEPNVFKVKGHEVGMGLVEGLINGMTGGLYGVVKAAHGLGEAAIDEVKDVFKVHSPSKVMEDIGQNVTAGFEQGVSDGGGGGPVMQDAFSPPDVKASSLGGGGRTIDVGGIYIDITGVASAEEIAPLLESQLTDVMERLANEGGA